MPTHRSASSPHLSEDQLRFKNLYTKALDMLRDADIEYKTFQAIEETCKNLQTDIDFWKQPTDGLLMLIEPNVFQAFNLPLDCEEYVAVDKQFHLTPAAGLLDYTEQLYYVLAISQEDPVLYRGDIYGLQQVNISLPKSVRAALNIDEWQTGDVQSHSIASGTGTQWHGHGAAKDRGEDELRTYLKKIDETICDKTDTKQPLFLAGTDRLAQQYRENSDYPHIMDGHIPAPDKSKDQNLELLAAVRQKIRNDLVSNKHSQLAERLKQNPSRAVVLQSELKTVAQEGRVEYLLLGFIQQTNDTTKDTHHPIEKLTFLSNEQMADAEALAAIVTKFGGEIITLDQSLMPSDKVAALLRY